MGLWVAIRFLHLLAMALFLGGQMLLAAAVVPVTRGDRDTLVAVARRFGAATVVAGLVLVATGVAMASHFHDWGRSALQVKLVLVAVIAALIAWHVRRPRAPALDVGIFLCSLAVVWLGVSLSH